MSTTGSRPGPTARGASVVRTAVVVLAVLAAAALSSCGADPHLQAQEARSLALTCHSLKERDRVTPVPAVPEAPFRKVIERPPTATGGKTNRDLLVKVVCPEQSVDERLTSLPFSFPFGDRSTTTTTTTTTPTTTPGATSAPPPTATGSDLDPVPGRRGSGNR